MQQVGVIAPVSAVDPRRLPVPVRRNGNKTLVAARRLWVLHKRIVVRLLAAFLCCVLIVGAYQARGAIGQGAAMLSDLMQGEFAEAGLGIDAMEITGYALTSYEDVRQALEVPPGTSILDYDVEAARQRVAKLPAIASVTIRKVYPDKLLVSVTEKTPVARWMVDGVTFVVDAAGEQIGDAAGGFGELPLVVGDGAADDALSMIRALDQFPALKNELAALARIGDRRWSLIYSTGLRVELPEQGVAQALTQLADLQARYQLLDRDVTQIDLRVDGLVAVRPTVREPAPDDKKKPAEPKVAEPLL